MSTDDAQTTPEILRSVIEKLESQQRAVADPTTTDNLKPSKDVEDFKAKMKAQREKAMADSNANID